MVFRDRKHIIEILDDIYYQYSDLFKNNLGENAWPFYKVQIGYILYTIYNNKFNPKNDNVKLQHIRLNYKISDLYKLCRQFIKLIFVKLKYKNRLANKILLFGYKDHYYKIKDKEVNSYLSPFKSEMEKRKIPLEELLLSQDPIHKNETELYYLYITLYNYQKSKYLLKNLITNRRSKAYKNAVIINDYFSEKGLVQHGYISKLLYSGQVEFEIKYLTSLQFLKLLSPKLIWTYCYYDSATMALIKAANYLKIDNVEYQHSIQPDEHFAYSKWYNIDSYKDFFPSKFWVWQQTDEDRIRKNFSGINYRPNPVFGGNLFSIQEKENNYSTLPEHKNGVLITLQGEWIPQYLETLIKEDSKYLWYFRLHPRYPEDKSQLLKFHEDYPSKTEIQDANNLTVYELFRKVKFHITAASGVALEAKGFGIRNIITGKFGLSAYQAEIEEGVFSYCIDKDTMSKLLYTESDRYKDLKSNLLVERQGLDSELNKLLFNWLSINEKSQ